MNKKKLLEALKQKALKDKNLPLREGANNLVFGDGNPNAKIYFLGEAPGRFEDLKGLPFVGQAGKLLNKLLEIAGIKREDVFITSVLWYRPPENRDPKEEEIETFRPYIDEQIKIIDPKIIITLGRHSLKKFLPDAKIGEVHGRPQRINLNGKEIILIPMYHPAAGLRSGKMLNALKEDFKKLAKL